MAKPKGRRVPPTPEQIAEMEIGTGVLPPDAPEWDTAEQLATLGPAQVAVGVARNRLTGLFHTWVSLYGADITSWYIGEEARAEEIAIQIRDLYAGWEGTEADIGAMEALLHAATLASLAPRGTLPDDQVRAILTTIARRQQRRN